MKSFLFSILVFLCATTGQYGFAQTAETTQTSPAGEAYLDALGFRRIETEVTYFDPAAPPPSLETSQKPPEAPDDADDAERGAFEWDTRFIFIVISGLILGGVFYLFVKHGGRFSVSLRPQVDNPTRRQGTSPAELRQQKQMPGNLRQILGMPDRGAALILLAQTALAKTAEFNGLLLQQSWTLRDALRRLPSQQTNLPALRDLVMASERVQFGGRTVAEDEFNTHVDRIKPLLNEVWT